MLHIRGGAHGSLVSLTQEIQQVLFNVVGPDHPIQLHCFQGDAAMWASFSKVYFSVVTADYRMKPLEEEPILPQPLPMKTKEEIDGLNQLLEDRQVSRLYVDHLTKVGQYKLSDAIKTITDSLFNIYLCDHVQVGHKNIAGNIDLKKNRFNVYILIQSAIEESHRKAANNQGLQEPVVSEKVFSDTLASYFRNRCQGRKRTNLIENIENN